MILAIDFDGVIHDNKNPLPGKRLGPPIAGAVETIDKLRWRKQAQIIIHSIWATGKGIDTIKEWLDFYGIHYDKITNIKPNADIYLDDKAVRFISWQEFASYMEIAED